MKPDETRYEHAMPPDVPRLSRVYKVSVEYLSKTQDTRIVTQHVL
jgi:hypothetical protein